MNVFQMFCVLVIVVSIALLTGKFLRRNYNKTCHLCSKSDPTDIDWSVPIADNVLIDSDEESDVSEK